MYYYMGLHLIKVRDTVLERTVVYSTYITLYLSAAHCAQSTVHCTQAQRTVLASQNMHNKTNHNQIFQHLDTTKTSDLNWSLLSYFRTPWSRCKLTNIYFVCAPVAKRN